MRELRRTCEDGHALIWHREWECPLCEVRRKQRETQEEADARWYRVHIEGRGS